MGEVIFISCLLVILIIFSVIACDVYLPTSLEGNKLSEIGIRGLTTLGILLIIIAVIMPFRVRNYFKPKIENYKTIADLGTIGDFIGGTTVAFLTAASVVLLLATIIMQRKEIKISQESIVQLVMQTKASIEQAEQARKETQITNTTMKKQQFETTFFNMVNLHHQIVDGMRITRIFEIDGEQKQQVYVGREVTKQLKAFFDTVLSFNPPKNTYISQKELDKLYGDFHNNYGNDIGHYMRNNYRIVKFIVDNVANDESEQKRVKQETGRELIVGDRRYYFGMLRAQWSNAEFALILINSLYSKHKKFKDLILKYDVLDMEDREDNSVTDTFKLKESMSDFESYKNLIEIKK